MRRPCLRSVKSCRVVLTIAEATAAVARTERGTAASTTRDSVIAGVFRRAGKGRPPGALPKRPQLKSLPVAFPSSSQPKTAGPACGPDPKLLTERSTALSPRKGSATE